MEHLTDELVLEEEKLDVNFIKRSIFSTLLTEKEGFADIVDPIHNEEIIFHKGLRFVRCGSEITVYDTHATQKGIYNKIKNPWVLNLININLQF